MKQTFNSQEEEILSKAEQARLKEEKKKERRDRWNDFFYYDVDVDLSVEQDGSMVRTLRKKKPIFLSVGLCIVFLLLAACFFAIDWSNTADLRWDQIGEVFASLFTPAKNSLKTAEGYWSYVWNTSIPSIWSTTEMCFLGTLLGSILSIPVYFLCARNTARKPYIYQPFRIFNALLRTIPQMVMAIILRFFFGANLITGIASITVFTLGIMYQLMYEFIETLEMSPFEAVRSNGGNVMQCIHLGLHPEILPMFFANFLYTFEINIRASVILGYVGAGGYGYLLQTELGETHYDCIGALLIPLFVEVIFLQVISNLLSRKSR